MKQNQIEVENKPKDVTQFIKWLKDKFDIEVDDDLKFYYEQNAKALKSDLENSSFWRNITTKLKDFNDEYKIGKNLDLFLNPDIIPEFYKKSYNSFILKVYRKNVIENIKWPKEPDKGWILPNNWMENIHDIIRTRLVVKYLDGVEFIIKKIEDQSILDNVKFHVDYEARDVGYYAAHINIISPIKIMDDKGKKKDINFCFEIQITTQLQDVLGILLHKYYDEQRKKIEVTDIKWQWNYKSDEFAPNYLGHILHYIEGMIMEIRNKQIK